MHQWLRSIFLVELLLLSPLLVRAQGQNSNVISDDMANVEDTTSPQRQQPEPTIAINPRNPDIIAAGAQDFRRATELRAACGGDRWNALYLSMDGGQTWSNSLVPGFCTDPTQGRGSEQAVSKMFGFSTNTDSVVAFDRFGNLYYTHTAFNADHFRTTPPSTSGVVFVSIYRDDGLTYAQTVKIPSGSGLQQAPFVVGPGIIANSDDKQWITVDNSPYSDFFGRVYVTWTKFNAQGGRSAVWISYCGGNGPGQEECAAEFTRGKVVNRPVPGGFVQESFPTTAPDKEGTVYVAFLQFQGGFGSTLPHSGVWVAKSTDGGETFTQQQVVDLQQIPSPLPPASTNANDGWNSFRTGTAPGIAVTTDGTVHLVWGEWVDGTHAEVRYARSTDRGQTWSVPISMNDDPTGHQFFPTIAVEDNTVHVAWYDGRLNPAGSTITDLQLFYNRSIDAGQTFETDVQLTDVPFDPNLVSRFPVFCAAFIGDYIDIDVVGGQVAVIWTDNRNVSDPLTPAECLDFQTRSTDPSIQGRLNSGALDQEAVVEIFIP